MEPSTPAVAAACRLLTLGSSDQIASALQRAGADPVANLILRAASAWRRGDIAGAEALLREACSSAGADGRDDEACDALAALLCESGRYARASTLIASPRSDAAGEARRAALRAVVRAATGAKDASLREDAAARAALDAARAGTAVALDVRVRLAHAACLRDDVPAALRDVPRGVRLAARANAPRAAAALRAIALQVHRRACADAAAAWRDALALRRDAARAGDALLAAAARDALAELGAERGLDAGEDGTAHRAPTTFAASLAVTLPAMWADDWSRAVRVLEAAPARTRGEHALSRALIALAAVARGDDADARRTIRRATALLPQTDRGVAADDARFGRLARVLASVAAELAGDALHAGRGGDARALAGDAAASALWRRRAAATPRAMPATVRGYARAMFAARASVARRPQRGLLTASEAAIVAALAAGGTVAQIAAATGRSRHTVRTHLRNASAKLDAHGRAELIAHARAGGVL